MLSSPTQCDMVYQSDLTNRSLYLKTQFSDDCSWSNLSKDCKSICVMFSGVKVGEAGASCYNSKLKSLLVKNV